MSEEKLVIIKSGESKTLDVLNKIFIHITPEFKKLYTETERKNLIDRFCNINEFTILLTERPEEEVSTNNYVIKCINRWIGHSQENRTPNN